MKPCGFGHRLWLAVKRFNRMLIGRWAFYSIYWAVLFRTRLTLPMSVAMSRFVLLFLLLHQAGMFSTFAAQEKIQLDASTQKIVASPWQLQTSPANVSLRGLQVVDQNIVWASGTGGTVINTIDAGKNWRVLKITGAEELDVRDVHAIDEATVIAMTSGTPARIYRSTNAGLSWKMVFESNDENVFLDAIAFFNDRVGVAMSDPIDDRLLLLKTQDSGLTWQRLSDTPKTFPKEAGFAASGTNMATCGGKKLVVGLGGGESARPMGSRVMMTDLDLKTWTVADVPLPRHESAGIFSVHFANETAGVIVGGDYKLPDATEGNFAFTRDGGKTWTVPRERKPPTGFRSCVSVWMNGNELNFVAVGPNGTDLSADLGQTWTRISNEGFHAIQYSPDGKFGWAAGGEGRVAKWLGRK